MAGDTMKVLVSDYDQTFYLNDDDLKKNKEAVKEFRNKGNIFIFATGRSHIDFLNKVNEYNLEYDYVILNHGSTILDKDGNVISNYPIKKDVIKEIVDDLDIDNSISHFFCNIENSRCNINDKDINKINVKYKDREKALEIKKLLDKKYYNYINSYIVMSGALEIMSSVTNKAKSINEILNILNIPKEYVYTIGDGYSDIQMIKEFNGYCIKDSIKELLDYCKDKKVESVSELIEKIK